MYILTTATISIKMKEIIYSNISKQRAQPADAWTGVWNATEDGPVCRQFVLSNFSIIGEEDCLFLNVYTPKLSQFQIIFSGKRLTCFLSEEKKLILRHISKINGSLIPDKNIYYKTKLKAYLLFISPFHKIILFLLGPDHSEISCLGSYSRRWIYRGLWIIDCRGTSHHHEQENNHGCHELSSGTSG